MERVIAEWRCAQITTHIFYEYFLTSFSLLLAESLFFQSS